MRHGDLQGNKSLHSGHSIAIILCPEKTHSMLYNEKAHEGFFRRMDYPPTNTAFCHKNHWHVIAITSLLVTKPWSLLVEFKQGCFLWDVRDIEITPRNPTLCQTSLSPSFYMTSTHFPQTLCAAGPFTPFSSSTCKNYRFPQSAMTVL